MAKKRSDSSNGATAELPAATPVAETPPEVMPLCDPVTAPPDVQAPPPETPAPNGQSPTRRPIKVFSYPVDTKSTYIRVAVWDKQIVVEARQITVYSATLSKSYVDAAGEFQTTQSLRGSEIPIAMHALSQAHSWMLEMRNGAR